MKSTENTMHVKDKLLIIWWGYKTIQRLEPYLLPMTFFGALLKAFSPFVTIYMTARIIDELLGARSASILGLYIGITIGLNFILFLASKGVDHVKDIADSRLIYLGQIEMGRLILNTDYENVENPEFHLRKQKIEEGSYINGGCIWGAARSLDTFMTSLFTVIFSITLALPLFLPSLEKNNYGFFASPWLSIAFLGLIILSSVYSIVSNSRYSQLLFQALDKIVPINRTFNFYQELIRDYKFGKDVRIYHQKDLIATIFQTYANKSGKFFSWGGKKQGLFYGINGAISAMISGFVYLFVGMKALIGLISIGSVVQYVGAITQFTTRFSDLVSSAANSWQNSAYLKLYFDFLDTPNQKYKGTLPVEKRADNEYEIEFKNVSFKYPGASDYALKNLTLKLKIGSHFAIVGMNGSGKTTFIKLLCRLYDPTEGEILLNGINIQKYDYNEYLRLFSVVFQDFQLFAFSAGQNVAADVNYDRETVFACLDQAGARERIGKMPRGLETPLYKVDEEGVDISGGEAQKIALARALYKNVPIVVLDEPTAALDPISEFEIYSKFQDMVGQKTAIYISHRLASCRFCDHILVFNNGELIQSGSHEQLIKDKNGKYSELWYAQAQYYKEDSARKALRTQAGL